jgi:hypothetical protein
MTSVQYLSELALRALARRAMRREQVPRYAPDETRERAGTRAPCAICDDPIRPDQVEIEMRFCPDRGCAIITVYPVHAPCFWIWQAERPAA